MKPIICPKCGYNIHGPEQWGCHCDLKPGEKPDECVFDTGDIFDCTFAENLQKENKKKESCQYWRKW